MDETIDITDLLLEKLRDEGLLVEKIDSPIAETRTEGKKPCVSRKSWFSIVSNRSGPTKEFMKNHAASLSAKAFNDEFRGQHIKMYLYEAYLQPQVFGVKTLADDHTGFDYHDATSYHVVFRFTSENPKRGQS